LVFSGTFFAQTNPKIAKRLAVQAADGAEVRLCFGDLASTAVAIRDEEEGLRGTLSAKIRAWLTSYTESLAVERCGIRLHGDAFTPRCSATTTRCWSTPTSEANLLAPTRCSICAAPKKAAGSMSTPRVSTRSGRPHGR
jgi:hypothetical protein